jgi:Putative peptidoglycan binding domain
MPRSYTMKEGDCVSSVAHENGFFAGTIWNDDANEGLRKTRDNMNVLSPGDVLVIPDKQSRTETRATGARHVFRRRGVPARLRVQICREGEPLASRPFRVDVDDGAKVISGTTDGNGMIDVAIDPSARKAHVSVGEGADARSYDLDLGHMRPLDDVAGVQDRLRNLGFDCGDERGEIGPNTQEALRAFQASQGLNPSGEVDAATRSKLTAMHDRP